MTGQNEILEEFTKSEYKYGFVTDIQADNAPKGLNEDIVRFISQKKSWTGFYAGMVIKSIPSLAKNGGAYLGPCSLS